MKQYAVHIKHSEAKSYTESVAPLTCETGVCVGERERAGTMHGDDSGMRSKERSEAGGDRTVREATHGRGQRGRLRQLLHVWNSARWKAK